MLSLLFHVLLFLYLSLLRSLLFSRLSCFSLLEYITLSSLILFTDLRQHIITIIMVGTRKTPFARTTVTSDGSPVRGLVDAEDDTIDIISVGLLPSWFFFVLIS
jgi:hypothetical protein